MSSPSSPVQSDPSTPQESVLESELLELLQCRRRSVSIQPAQILGWLQGAQRTIPSWAGTAWGLRMLRVLLVAMTDDATLCSPAVVGWMKDHLLPCLLPEPSMVDGVHNDVAYLFTKLLLEQLLLLAHAPPVSSDH